MRYGIIMLVSSGLGLWAGCSAPNDSSISRAISHYSSAGVQPAIVAQAPAAAPMLSGGWLAQSREIAQAERDSKADNGAAAASGPSSRPAAGGTAGTGVDDGRDGHATLNYVPWRERYGPAYPGDFWRSFGRYAKELPLTLWDDTEATFTNPVSLVGFGLAGAAGIAIAGSGADDEVSDHTHKHGSQLNGFWDSVGDAGGNPWTHFAAAGAFYFYTLGAGDEKNYEVAQTLLNALMINGLVTESLKTAVNTRSPNGDPRGWPSGHESSSFCVATVMYEEYGPYVGVPMFAFASFVGYERIDARNHDFSDVVSGALIGMAIGHAVAKNHKMRIAGLELAPYVDDRGGVGLALIKQW